MARQALGKGLDALIPGASKGNKKEIGVELKISDIMANKNQPRKNITAEELKELIKSIQADGVLTPILVKTVGNGKYEIVAGERRFVAAKRAGLKVLPCVVKKNISTIEQHKMAVIENIQRQDLNSMEEATAYKELMEGYHCTQEELSEKLGKNRATIANTIRLLRLPIQIQQYVIENKISQGHAKLLLGIENKNEQKSICEQIVKNNFSVRDAEKLLKKEPRENKRKYKIKMSPEMLDIEKKLIHFFGTKVKIKGSYKKGKIEIEYYNSEDFDRITEKLKI